MDNKEISISLNLASNKDSNLFLRKLYSSFHFNSFFNDIPSQAKLPSENLVTISLFSLYGETMSMGIKYKKKGCIQSLIFWNVPEIHEKYLRETVKEAKDTFLKPLQSIKIGYAFEAEDYYVAACQLENFDITVDEGFVNNISIEVEGYSIYDVFPFNQYKADICLNIIAMYFDIPFDYSNNYSSRSNTIRIEQLGSDKKESDFYKELVLTDELKKILNKVVLTPTDLKDIPVFRATRLYRDALRLERYGINNLSISFKEVAHTFYMSAFEVLAYDGSTEIRKNKIRSLT